eukprot:TRINITY_DN31925_c0_g1_i1.p1 TRINITY_DN31925_c0_g1~~TRINITY_DN31925_c0_g1_i1.p1  ORF type:complete len:344 (+),score=46.70 TRINITY_DN31925_c0_g1_i1:1-1032(+)
MVKVMIVIFVIMAGTDFVKPERLTNFFPNGFGATLTAAATLNYAYIGYDVIASAAEECKEPQRSIPISIIMTLFTCATLYVAMCFVLCGMQDSQLINEEAPVSSAFLQYGMFKFASVINIGAVVGLVGGTLAGIYGQSRLYFALARDDLAPAALHDTPRCCIWCGSVAAVLAAFLDVEQLGSFLNIGVLLAYSITAASVLCINSDDRKSEKKAVPLVGVLVLLSGSSFVWWPVVRAAQVALVAALLWFASARNYGPPTGTFHCPGLPLVPLIGFMSNVYLAGELSWNAWSRLLVVSIVVICLHSWATFSGLIDHHARKTGVCQTVRAAAETAGTESGICRGRA